MKFEIMLKILFELLYKKSVSATYLSKKYGVSIRTIYRYVSSIELAGVPIYTKRGSGGGFSIVDSYRISSSFLTSAEFEKVISTLTAVCQEVPNDNLDSAITKLKATVKPNSFDYEVKSEDLIIDGGPWGDAVSYRGKLSVISKATQSREVLLISYHDRNGEVTKREIEPHAILFKQGIWYVLAYCRLRKDFRYFKTGRIEYAGATGEKFERKNISEEVLDFSKWYQKSETLDVTFEVSPNVRSDIEEWLGIENVTDTADGKIWANAKLPDENGLVPKILSYGVGLKVIAPNSLAEKIIKVAKEIAEKYS